MSNRGNVVGTVKDSFNSKAFGKALKAGAQAGAISGLTAGVTQVTGLGSMTNQVGGVEVAKSGASRYIALGQRGLVQGAATSVVTGEKLKKSLEQSMGSAALAIGQMAVGDIAASSGMADGSVTKVAMHAAVGGVYSVANGGKFATGAIGGAAGEVLGSNIDANDKAGGAKVQFATTVGGFLAGANAKDMQMAANVAVSSFEHNRKLHASELSVLEKLKEDKTPEEQNRLDKAAKYLVKASAGVNENDPQYRGLVAEEAEGAKYVAEQKQLQDFAQALHEKSRYARDMELYLAAETKGVMGDTSKYKQRTFDYTRWDENIDDPLSRREEYFGRARGGVQMAGGAVGTVGAYATAAGITAETGGLAAPQAVFLAGLGGASYQYSKDGANKLLGPYSHKEGSAVQNSFKQPDSTTYSGQLVKNTAVDVATTVGIAKVSNLALRGAMAAEQSIAAKSAAKPSTSTTPMTSANGNNSPGNDGVTLYLKDKKGGMTAASKASLNKKAAGYQTAAQEGSLVKTQPAKRNPKLSEQYREQLNNRIDEVYGASNPESAAKMKKRLKKGYDIDHIIDLQLGGKDNMGNLQILDRGMNRSLGPQIGHQLKNIPEGTTIDSVVIKKGKEK